MKKRTVAALCAAVLAMSALAGCGGSSSAGTAASEPAAQAAEEPAAQAAEEPAAEEAVAADVVEETADAASDAAGFTERLTENP